MSTPGFKIGLFGIGLDTYWSQFEGLEKRLIGNLDAVFNRLKGFHPQIVNAGLVDCTDRAFEAGIRFRQENVGLVFLYVSTYALSSTVLPVVQRLKVPVIILNLTEGPTINYEAFNALPDINTMTGEWLAWCNACPVPELANAFRRTGIAFYQVTGTLAPADNCWNDIAEWIAAGKVAHVMSYNRMGCIGHYYSGMLDIYTDLTLQIKYFGGHFEHIEVDELSALRKTITEQESRDRITQFANSFEIDRDCSQEGLRSAAITSLALDKLVERYHLGSIAYYYKGSGNAENLETISSIIAGNSLLTARGIPVAGEYEIKNAQAMKIMDSFGAGGSFTEYYALDLAEDVVLMGHDGPAHIAIAEGSVKLKPLKAFHGKVGSGLSVEMSVKSGPVTLLSIAEDGAGKLRMIVAEGHAVAGPTLHIGNTNSRYKFKCGAIKFMEEWNSFGPAHHCAVGVGHIANRIRKLGDILGMEVVTVNA